MNLDRSLHNVINRAAEAGHAAKAGAALTEDLRLGAAAFGIEIPEVASAATMPIGRIVTAEVGPDRPALRGVFNPRAPSA